MRDDGSEKTLQAGFPAWRAWGSPSRQLHAGKRWLLQWYNDEVYVLSDAGDVVRLTNDPALQSSGNSEPQWGIGDAFISWVARWWDLDPESPTFGTVVEGGLYVAQLEVDEAGNIVGLAGPPELLVEMPLVPSSGSTLWPDIRDHSWSPDGTQFVYDTVSAQALWICDPFASPEAAFRLLYQPASTRYLGRPRWSPAGDKVLFQDGSLHGSVGWVSIDGTNVKTIASGNARKGVGLPRWWSTSEPLARCLRLLHRPRLAVIGS
jgi:hypothetical protein